ncbi:MAG: response regulator [Anaerolineae bacterium]
MKRILVVDDDKTILELLKDALPALGYRADFAIAGNQAINMIKARSYDLILSDIRMPEINGIDVARAAYQDRPEVPILFMSGNPNTIVEDRSFLAKPFTLTELETKIEFALTPAES